MAFAAKLVIALSLLQVTQSLDILGKVVDKICPPGDEVCEKAAARCLKFAAPTKAKKNEIASAMDSCITKLSLKETYDAFLQTHENNSEDRSYLYKPYTKYLDDKDAKAATNFRCCFGQTTKSIGFDKNLDKQVLIDKINEKTVDDPVVKKAFLSAVDTCDTKLVNCQASPFLRCSLNTCMKAVNNQ